MRARIASCLALVAFTLAGCEGVPDLRFADGDGGTSEDATLPTTTDGSPALDSTVGPGADAGDDAAPADDASPPGPPLPEDGASPPPPTDGAPPPDTGCPGTPPGGTTCCGNVACKGTPQQCNCGLCAYCASQGYCCPSAHPPPGYCATELKDCH
jgi:hypothetical protein